MLFSFLIAECLGENSIQTLWWKKTKRIFVQMKILCTILLLNLKKNLYHQKRMNEAKISIDKIHFQHHPCSTEKYLFWKQTIYAQSL